jgi:hypothetical protein
MPIRCCIIQNANQSMETFNLMKYTTSLNRPRHLQDGIWDHPTLITYDLLKSHRITLPIYSGAQNPIWIWSKCTIQCMQCTNSKCILQKILWIDLINPIGPNRQCTKSNAQGHNSQYPSYKLQNPENILRKI